ncbi:peptidoglycan-binding domain-containing protein [Pseudoroseicyclus tamaricis]|uniref:Peptidoglycan-binding protein n=1 Tax=Pseudoroseicyclus tamaricis TaxID=2705421 RepID=A0A6B2K2F9_9RHOB|nr:peptidoglycan-binding domain-containing protein [Pseudoroseicyclus tamaricis]NDV02744.1 peptidoglycan-binding protein [Pseudoroseicyclus tamaricis]
MRHLIMTTALAALTAAPAAADDAALLIGIEQYEQLTGVPGAADVIDAADELTDMGFTVLALPNARIPSATQAIAEWVAEVPDAERLFVALTGRFVTDGERSWLVTAEAGRPTLMTAGQEAISVDSLLQILGDRPGNAILFLGAAGQGRELDEWLRDGLGPISPPQGVTVVTGPPDVMADLVSGPVLEPEADILAPLRDERRVELYGYLPRQFEFMPSGGFAPSLPGRTNSDRQAEEALWQGAQALDTVQAYRNYLQNYPVGDYADEAEEAIRDIVSEPNRAARLIEEAMRLSREERQEVQRDLTMLGYNTRGVDGIFGPGTRGAITNWQQENGFSQTSYLTPDHITRIDAQAARRAAELEAEAERRAAAERRADNSFWDETGSDGGEAGLRAYLDRYPDGLHAAEARSELEDIEAAKRARARQVEREAWDRVRDADTIAAYDGYLRNYPSGSFVEEAEARRDELRRQLGQQDEMEAAQARENGLNLNSFTRRLVETRLDNIGLQPGPVDGQFNEQTRQALRRYQRDRQLDVTGYLNEETIVRLLADAIER